ncbi:TPA: hypothetical protein ROY17_005784 [Bacillus thuringiensis]|nr:hypothetical protein [Bacillus thuringiensis]
MIDVGTLGGLHSKVYDVNFIGAVVGAAKTGNGNTVAVAWSPNPNGSYTITSLGTLGGNNSAALMLRHPKL